MDFEGNTEHSRPSAIRAVVAPTPDMGPLGPQGLCSRNIIKQANDLNFPVGIIDLAGMYLYRNRPLDLLLDGGTGGGVADGAKIQDFFDAEFCDERLEYCERVVSSRRSIRLADFVRGTRFVTTLHPMLDGPWPRSVLVMVVPRAPKPSEANELIQVRNRDEGLFGTLTRREVQVLGMLAQGLTHKEIAAAIGRTIKTVETHRAAIGRKLRVHKNIHLVQIAINAGLLDSDTNAIIDLREADER